MESANSHHHQDQLVGSSASSLPNPSCYGLGFTSTHPWPSPSFLNTTNCLSSYPSEAKEQVSPTVSSQIYCSISPDLAFNWCSNINNNNNNNHNNNNNSNNSEQDLQHESSIKEEMADHYYRKYSEMLSNSPVSSTTDELSSLRKDLQLQGGNDVATKFLLKSFSSYGKIPDFYSCPESGFVNSTQTAVACPMSLDMSLEALDLFATSQNQIGMLRDGFSNYGFDQMYQSHHIPFYASNKVSSTSSNAVAEAKRNSNKMDRKSHIQKPPKKLRLEARSSCPPFKVRKEKLGDRIAALQQLVAPFGKTDTASVLMEAIGYIKFLQTQVETLSVPYMKASRNKPNRITKGIATENENEEAAKRDLQSRGLCLVPLSCLSYITDGGGPAVWPPSHFGGAA